MSKASPVVCGFAGGRMHHPKPAANPHAAGDVVAGGY